MLTVFFKDDKSGNAERPKQGEIVVLQKGEDRLFFKENSDNYKEYFL